MRRLSRNRPALPARGRGADLGGPYVLAVSTLEPRKNLPALVSAFALLRQRQPELTLALAGLAGWEERPLAAEGVRLLGFVSDDELARLYRGAVGLRLPVALRGLRDPGRRGAGERRSRRSSPRIRRWTRRSGDAALRADPDDPEAFADALEQALDEPRGTARRALPTRPFTWRACGEAVLAGYERALRH